MKGTLSLFDVFYALDSLFPYDTSFMVVGLFPSSVSVYFPRLALTWPASVHILSSPGSRATSVLAPTIAFELSMREELKQTAETDG